MIFLCFTQVALLISFVFSVIFALDKQFEYFLESRDTNYIIWSIIWFTILLLTEFMPAIAFAWTLTKLGRLSPEEEIVNPEVNNSMAEE